MRGKPHCYSHRRTSSGNIPAYAGKTGMHGHGLPSLPEHPRIRGENRLKDAETGIILGTSPHTRGKLPTEWGAGHGDRNIPAYAGKTQGCSGGVDLHAEHPRIRGENGYAGFHRYRAAGTSPHTRGKRRFCNHAAGASRNIPAYAGKTHDSPRACFLPVRNIPAYAGKTAPPLLQPCLMTEHPRIRGENWTTGVGGVRKIGTSPHTRGKLSPRGIRFCASRNIPAYAGKTD